MKSTKKSDRRPRLLRWPVLLALLALVLSTGGLVAQPAAATAQPVIVTCTSAAGDLDRQRCDADTSAGVLLQRSVGSAECLLGRNWGYDGQGVWVSEGCSGEFLVSGVPPQEPVETAESAEAPAEGAETAESAVAPAEEEAAPADDQPEERWGFLDPGKGFLLGKGKGGELRLSAYALVRYHEPDGRRRDLLRPSRPGAPRQGTTGHLLPTGPGLVVRLGGRAEAGVHDHLLGVERDQ